MDVDDFVLVESMYNVVPDLIQEGWVCWDHIKCTEKTLHKENTRAASKSKSKKKKRVKRKNLSNNCDRKDS